MKLRITLDNKTYDVDVEIDDSQAASAPYAPATFVASAAAPAMPLAGGSGSPAPAGVAEDKVCRSPMVGIIVRINVQEGEHVQKDDPILVLEAMKMETTITSPVAGKVKTILVSASESVQAGQVLVEFE
jgi:methylmalonyl-CoA carboxyltransferase 1.3S subunit